MGLLRDCHPDHHWHQLFSSPGDFGFNGTARIRTWCIGSHKSKTSCLQDPFLLHESIKNYIQGMVQCQISDYLVASKAEIQMEAQQLALRRDVKPPSDLTDNLAHLLCLREIRTKCELDYKYEMKFHAPPTSNPNLVYFLGDSSDYCSWSAVSQQIPTYRLNSSSGIYWLAQQKRWLTSKERLVSMGFPVTIEQAQALKVPCLGASDVVRANDMVLGNSFHFQSAGIMQLIALASFGPCSDDLMENSNPEMA